MQTKLVVVKFGGSSLAEAGQFKKVAEIIQADASRRYVVPSAPGKRHSKDEKVTDLLYACYKAVKDGENFDRIFEKITDRYESIQRELHLSVSLEHELEMVRTTLLSGGSKDYAASRGEYLNGILLADYLGYDFIDAAEVIFFDENGSYDSERTNTALKKALACHERAVIPGFYGASPDGTVKTFSRGGSDITGSIVARAAEADLYENWTDVSGFLMADPRIVERPKTIETITYHELRELSYMGAGVLHEDAIFPVRFSGIPINIRNTNDPAAKGTMIVAGNGSADSSAATRAVTGIAGKKGFCVITLEKDMMNQEIGFGRRVLGVLEEEGICFEHLPSGIDTMCVVLNQKDLEGKRDRILHKICQAVSPDSISIVDHLALIAVVGRGMIRTKGTASRLFNAIAGADINVRMIDQGSSELNIIIGVDDSDFERATRAIYEEFAHDTD